MSRTRTFVGFGFGAIQAGLFLYEAFRSGHFDRLVVAEIMPDLVRAVNGNGGRYSVNVATASGIERHEVGGVVLHDPRDTRGREALLEAIAGAAEIATALPSVDVFGTGKPGDVVDVLSAGLRLKAQRNGLPAVIYTAENHNHAAEILQERLCGAMPDEHRKPWQTLNTVIGKMSGVVSDPGLIREQRLDPIVPGFPRAFLVETFNHILITRITIPGFARGIEVFEEREDLLPFEEAKLYGHNATHALIGYMLKERGRTWMAEAGQDPELVSIARAAFVEESGGGLCRKFAGLDPLFSKAGYAAYADDLLARMLNPYLRDSVERVTRDPRRKLGWDDRLIGTMRMAMSQGISPRRYAAAAALAFDILCKQEQRNAESLACELWPGAPVPERNRMLALVVPVHDAAKKLRTTDYTDNTDMNKTKNEPQIDE